MDSEELIDNVKVFSQAVALSMTKMQRSDILVNYVVDQLLQSELQAAIRRRVTGLSSYNQCFVNYTVRFQTSITQLSLEASFQALKTELIDAANGGEIDTYLATYADHFKAAYMVGVTTRFIASSPTYYIVTSSQSGGGGSEGDSGITAEQQQENSLYQGTRKQGTYCCYNLLLMSCYCCCNVRLPYCEYKSSILLLSLRPAIAVLHYSVSIFLAASICVLPLYSKF